MQIYSGYPNECGQAADSFVALQVFLAEPEMSAAEAYWKQIHQEYSARCQTCTSMGLCFVQKDCGFESGREHELFLVASSCCELAHISKAYWGSSQLPAHGTPIKPPGIMELHHHPNSKNVNLKTLKNQSSQSTSVGVIEPFGEGTSNEDVTEALKEAGFNGAVAERIFKGKEKIKTSMFKVAFDSNSLPPFVRIGYQQYRVNTYIGKPWQCYKCQRFGHSAAFSRSAPRCVVCSGPHTSNECNKTTGQICCNCGGNHTANYG
ncbi:hypothetical protein FHG87_007578 [Trinorchestia longiramus]|nr:hypothetical protein FHG87_007578 [Trinorchestia longiramus]